VCVSLRQDLLKAHVGVRVFETRFTEGSCWSACL
jgi:hypothetical protein